MLSRGVGEYRGESPVGAGKAAVDADWDGSTQLAQAQLIAGGGRTASSIGEHLIQRSVPVPSPHRSEVLRLWKPYKQGTPRRINPKVASQGTEPASQTEIEQPRGCIAHEATLSSVKRGYRPIARDCMR